MSDLGKFEKSDLMPEIVTAKNEYVTISHRSEKSAQSYTRHRPFSKMQVAEVLSAQVKFLCLEQYP